MQGRAAVERELAFGCAREDIGRDAGGARERVNLDSFERLDAGCGQKLGTDQARAVVHRVEAGHLQLMDFAVYECAKHGRLLKTSASTHGPPGLDPESLAQDSLENLAGAVFG